MKKGFTMPEILVAVMILTILVTMAVPMYERAVEKSRIAEVSITLKRMLESKLRVMDDRNMVDYDGSFSKSQLDSSFNDTSDFAYRMNPGGFANAVCAIRKKGDNAGTAFLYLGETGAEYCGTADDPTSNSTAVCNAYRQVGEKFFCTDGTSGSCDTYGMNSISFGSCN